ncbi:hypothetical protein, partial [Nesterenkonia sp. PF2B19]|uniref:hypothetical protein n=1 Tax=Nesterenkonia sp. PF2B19 TaxID=1881858 RepID=UPI000A22500D
ARIWTARLPTARIRTGRGRSARDAGDGVVVIAPATSGQPEETESQAFIPASLEDSAQDDAAPASKGASGSGGTDPDRKSPLSARDRWILEQRPPHWD